MNIDKQVVKSFGILLIFPMIFIWENFNSTSSRIVVIAAFLITIFLGSKNNKKDKEIRKTFLKKASSTQKTTYYALFFLVLSIVFLFFWLQKKYPFREILENYNRYSSSSTEYSAVILIELALPIVSVLLSIIMNKLLNDVLSKNNYR